MLEALALGVPVVSTAVMGTADVLAGVAGAVVAPDEIEGFAATVVTVLGDAELRRRLAHAAPHDASAWSAVAVAMATQLAALYAELATSAGDSRYSSRPSALATDPACPPNGSE